MNHLRVATDSIGIHQGSFLIQLPSQQEEDAAYHSEEALRIVDVTTKLLKSVSDHGGKDHITLIIEICPDVTVCTTEIFVGIYLDNSVCHYISLVQYNIMYNFRIAYRNALH